MKYRLIKLVSYLTGITSLFDLSQPASWLAQIKDNQHKIIHRVKLKFCAHLSYLHILRPFC